MTYYLLLTTLTPTMLLILLILLRQIESSQLRQELLPDKQLGDQKELIFTIPLGRTNAFNSLPFNSYRF